MYRTLFFPMINYPSPTLPGSIATALGLANAWNAHLVALNSEASAPTGVGFSVAMPFLGTMIKAERAKARANAEAVFADFERQANQAGVRYDITPLKHEVFDPSAWEVAARFADLSLLFVEDGSGLDEWCAETVLFGSGRPGVVLPARAEAQTLVFKKLAIAWDGGRAAARAVRDALPILRQAEATSVLVAAPDKDASLAQPERLIEYLHRSGVPARAHVVSTETRTASEVLTAAAGDFGADLLVLGAYGHSQLRNFILGGVTEKLLRSPPLPLFLSH